MNVLSDRQLEVRYISYFLAGALIALLALRASTWWTGEPVTTPSPRILLQTSSQTVARIPTQHAGKRVDCVVTIDQARNVWSITC